MDSAELSRVVTAMIPYALAGVFVPSWTKYVIVILGSKRPILNASSYILGNAIYRLALGVAVLLSFQVEFFQEAANRPPGGANTYLIILGLMLVSIGVYLVRKRPRETAELPGWLRALESIKPWMAFLAGLGMMAAPGVQYVYFLGGMGVVANSELTAPVQVVLLLGFTAFLELMLLAPVVIFALGGAKAATTMQSFKEWLGRNEFKVFGVIIGAFGLFTLVKAL